MASDSSFASHISLNSDKARWHCPPFLHALNPALQMRTSGSNFASHISLSSATARCHCSPFSHSLIPALKTYGHGLRHRIPQLAEQLSTLGSSFTIGISLSSGKTRFHCTPLSDKC
ncbi:unnamed protein product [Prorocentrum cordatum]|uniref:Uncharacterized protein n=1 Tax=Prorocentrum cordatum TaxID=2364126 RepID=A0ABN9PMG5_9DINO|nr:unnamed protein product [Polarella glacialis]